MVIFVPRIHPQPDTIPHESNLPTPHRCPLGFQHRRCKRSYKNRGRLDILRIIAQTNRKRYAATVAAQWTKLLCCSTWVHRAKARNGRKLYRTTNVRATCLKVDYFAAPGTYQWGKPTGEKLQPGEKLTIRSVTKLPSRLGEYYWIKVEPWPAH